MLAAVDYRACGARDAESWSRGVRPRAMPSVVRALLDMPSSYAYRTRFGSLTRAYSLIGYTPLHDYSYLEANRAIRELHRQHCSSMISRLVEGGARLQQDSATGLLRWLWVGHSSR